MNCEKINCYDDHCLNSFLQISANLPEQWKAHTFVEYLQLCILSLLVIVALLISPGWRGSHIQRTWRVPSLKFISIHTRTRSKFFYSTQHQQHPARLVPRYAVGQKTATLSSCMMELVNYLTVSWHRNIASSWSYFLCPRNGIRGHLVFVLSDCLSVTVCHSVAKKEL